MKLVVSILGTVFFGVILTGCSPEVGSPEWCADMKNKDKGEWTTNDMRDFTRHCLFK